MTIHLNLLLSDLTVLILKDIQQLDFGRQSFCIQVYTKHQNIVTNVSIF